MNADINQHVAIMFAEHFFHVKQGDLKPVHSCSAKNTLCNPRL